MYVYIVYLNMDFFVFLNLKINSKIFFKNFIESLLDLKIKEGDNANQLF